MWLVAIALESKDIEHVHHGRGFYWTALVLMLLRKGLFAPWITNEM